MSGCWGGGARRNLIDRCARGSPPMELLSARWDRGSGMMCDRGGFGWLGMGAAGEGSMRPAAGPSLGKNTGGACFGPGPLPALKSHSDQLRRA